MPMLITRYAPMPIFSDALPPPIRCLELLLCARERITRHLFTLRHLRHVVALRLWLRH